MIFMPHFFSFFLAMEKKKRNQAERKEKNTLSKGQSVRATAPNPVFDLKPMCDVLDFTLKSIV